jgi:hypothetical protein
MEIACSGCGHKHEIADTEPLSLDIQYHCSSCLSPERKRFKYRPNIEAQRQIKEKLDRFVGLPLEEHEIEWFSLCAELGIDEIAVEQFVSVVNEGKWRNSRSPRWYLQTTVKRRFASCDAPMWGLLPEEIELEVSTAGYAGYQDGMHLDQNLEKRTASARKENAWARLAEFLAAPTAEDLRETDPLLSQHWTKDELGVINARVLRVSRDRYLQSAPTEDERLRRQAAWRRVDRKGLPDDRLRDELRRASRARLASPEWEDRAERDALLDYVEDPNEFESDSGYGLGGGRRIKAKWRE